MEESNMILRSGKKIAAVSGNVNNSNVVLKDVTNDSELNRNEVRNGVLNGGDDGSRPLSDISEVNPQSRVADLRSERSDPRSNGLRSDRQTPGPSGLQNITRPIAPSKKSRSTNSRIRSALKEAELRALQNLDKLEEEYERKRLERQRALIIKRTELEAARIEEINGSQNGPDGDDVLPINPPLPQKDRIQNWINSDNNEQVLA